jgi:dTDP-4-dehydrorhamnose reductase
MHVLIAGANGQLGRDCQTVLGAFHDLCALDLPELDIADPSSVRRWFEAFRPEAVVNCAAYTRVDDAERESERAFAVNATGPAVLAQACAAAGARLLHVSTDYVFDGARPPPAVYVEDDAPNPLSVYGRSKLAGETPVLALPGGAVLRTAWLYGQTGQNFLRTMLRLARRTPPRPLRVVNDQFGSPTWSGRLARQIARLLEDFRPGLYHASAEGSTNWYELAARFLGNLGVPHAIEPIGTADYPTPARRPANAVLENRNLKARGLNVMIDWRVDLDAFAATAGADWLEEPPA